MSTCLALTTKEAMIGIVDLILKEWLPTLLYHPLFYVVN